jgi:sugar phosphate isomerase/epimerase
MKLRSIVLAVASWCATTGSIFAKDESPAKRDDSASEKLGMKLSLQCYTYRAISFFETVDKAARLGVKYLEIYPGQTLKPGSKQKMSNNMSDAVCEEIAKKLADAGGLKLVAYGVHEVPNDEAAARRYYEWAKKMGIEVLVTETVPTALHDKLCQEYGLKFALHNHPKTWPPQDVLKASEGHSKWIGSCSDTGHWMRANLVPVEQVKKLGTRVLHSHFKDLNKFGEPAHDLPWGTGKGNPKATLEALKDLGYKGYFSIEYEYGDVAHLDENLPKCVAFFDKTMEELAK